MLKLTDVEIREIDMMQTIIGKWKIVDMDVWSVESEWFIEFNAKGSGEFHFLCVNAEIDYRSGNNKQGKKIEFTFHGDDEGDEVFGRGWVEIDGASLDGYICFHHGEESRFKAKKI